MRHALILCLAALVLAAPVAAQEKDVRKEAEAAFFKAYYEETGKRDLKTAANAFEEFIWVYEAEGKCRDLVVRAFLALGRIQARSGKDPKGFLDAAEGMLPVLTDREQVQLIRRELAAARALTGAVDAQDAVAAQIRVLVDALGENKSAEEALKLFGARAVPELAKSLSSTDPRKVAAAARVTVALRGEGAVKAVEAALARKDLLFPVQVAESLLHAGPEFAPAFKAALTHRSFEVRERAVIGLLQRLGRHSSSGSYTSGADAGNPVLQTLALKALSDEEAEVRRSAIRIVLRGPDRVKAVETGIGDPDPKTRTFAVNLLATLRKSDLPGEMAEPILNLIAHEDPSIRRQIVRVALEMGGETARKVIVKALEDKEGHVVYAAADRIIRGDPAMEPAYLEGMIRFARDQAGTGKKWATAMSALDRVFEVLEPQQAADLLPLFSVWSEWEHLLSMRAHGVPVKRPFDYLAGRVWRLGPPWNKGPEQLPAGFLTDAYGELAHPRSREIWIRLLGDHLKGLSVEQFREAMESPDEKLRTQAVALAPAVLGAGAREELARWLRDPSESVRKAAAGKLVSTCGREVVEFMKNAVIEDASLTYSVVSRLPKILSDEELRAFVAEAFSCQKTDNGKYEVIYGAGSLVSDQHVLEGLRSSNLSLREQAANIAGNRQLLEAWPLLLGSRHSFAINAQKQIENYYLGLKKYRDVKQMLETGGDALEKAREMVRSEKPAERRAAVYALGALGDPTAISLLLDLVRDPDENVREAALGALERLGGAPGREKAAK